MGLKLPTWITLKQLPLDYSLSAELIARGSGEILGVDQVHVTAKFPRFYIALDVEQGWVGAISLPSLDPTQQVSKSWWITTVPLSDADIAWTPLTVLRTVTNSSTNVRPSLACEAQHKGMNDVAPKQWAPLTRLT